MSSLKLENTKFPSWLNGQWQEENEEVFVLISINIIELESSSEIEVKAVDLSDGEEMVVSNLSFENEILKFDTLVPSNKYWASHEFHKTDEDGVIEHYVTFKEIIRRLTLSSNEPNKKPETPSKK